MRRITMDLRQTLATSAILGGACFLGAFLGTHPTTIAHAQVRSTPQPKVEYQDWLFVPRSGLRLIDEGGRTLGMIGGDATGTRLVLMDAEGAPSIVLAAGTGGQAGLIVSAGSSQLQIRDTAGGATALGVTSQGAGLSVRNRSGSTAELMARAESSVTLGTPRTKTAFEARSSDEGGVLNLFSNSGKATIQLTPNKGTGLLQVNDADGAPSFLASGEGKVSLTKDKKVLWQAPAASTGTSE